jgi:hypothetical protein
LNAEKRAKETGNAPNNRLEITAPMPSTFAMVRLGEHQLAMAHSTRQLPGKNRRLKFRALTAEKRAKETGNAPTNRLEFTALLPFNFVLVRLGEHQLALVHSAPQRCPLILRWSAWLRVALPALLERRHPLASFPLTEIFS